LDAKGTYLYNRWAYIGGGGLISRIISLLANRRAYNWGWGGLISRIISLLANRRLITTGALTWDFMVYVIKKLSCLKH